MTRTYTKSQARKDLPTRRRSDSKIRGGKCLIIAGSSGMWGAALLCATASARAGAGYTHLLAFNRDFPPVKAPDFLFLPNLRNHKLSEFQSIAIGPGLKPHQRLKKTIDQIATAKHPHVVIDAGALQIIAQRKKPVPKTWILTPHEGELARMLKVSSQTVKADRHLWVQKAQKQFGCLVLLKGSPTLIAMDKEVWEIRSGNPALAKAGTGDVLTGIIAGFLSQGLSPLTAAQLGAYVHGQMAHDWVRSGHDVLSLMASDLLLLLPRTLRKLRVVTRR